MKYKMKILEGFVVNIRTLRARLRAFYYIHAPSCLYSLALKRWYYKNTKCKLNLSCPKTFNEKIQWSKLYDSTPIKSKLADKYAVREWIKEKIGKQYLIPLFGVYDRFEDIDFKSLPEQFVIKCNHGSSYNIIVRDKTKLDFLDTKRKLNYWMHENFAFKMGFELQYSPIKPKIIIEKYMATATQPQLIDYKFYVFNGIVKFLYVSQGMENHATARMSYIDVSTWTFCPFCRTDYCPLVDLPDKPTNLTEMCSIVESLAKGFPFVRVDLYEINGTIYFSEMTFTPSSGIALFSPKQYDTEIGNWFLLPKQAYDIKTGKYYEFPFKQEG